MSKGKILIVEPDEDYRRMLDTYLEERLEFEIHYALSVEACLDALKSFEPHVLLFAHDEFKKGVPIDNLTKQIMEHCEQMNIYLVFLYNPLNESQEVVDSRKYVPLGLMKPYDIEELASRVLFGMKARKWLQAGYNWKILIVEPDDIIREWLEVELVCDGYDVYLTTNSTDAYKLFQDTEPDIVLIDLAKSNGYDFIRFVVTNYELPFLTMQEGVRYDGKNLVLDGPDLFKKPFTEEERQKLGEWTARYREECGE